MSVCKRGSVASLDPETGRRPLFPLPSRPGPLRTTDLRGRSGHTGRWADESRTPWTSGPSSRPRLRPPSRRSSVLPLVAVSPETSHPGPSGPSFCEPKGTSDARWVPNQSPFFSIPRRVDPYLTRESPEVPELTHAHSLTYVHTRVHSPTVSGHEWVGRYGQ